MIETCQNYIAVVEEHFRAARGTPLFRFSPLDWALAEEWEKAGVSLKAVLRGIDVAFEKFRRRPSIARTQSVNSLAYCAQAVAAEAQALSNAEVGRSTGANPFSNDEIRDYVFKNAAKLRAAGHPQFAGMLDRLDVDNLSHDLERLEQRLITIEEMMVAHLSQTVTPHELAEIRSELERELKPYRSKMTADQLAMLEQKFTERKVLESAGLPRLSLFYL